MKQLDNERNERLEELLVEFYGDEQYPLISTMEKIIALFTDWSPYPDKTPEVAGEYIITVEYPDGSRKVNIDDWIIDKNGFSGWEWYDTPYCNKVVAFIKKSILPYEKKQN